MDQSEEKCALRNLKCNQDKGNFEWEKLRWFQKIFVCVLPFFSIFLLFLVYSYPFESWIWWVFVVFLALAIYGGIFLKINVYWGALVAFVAFIPALHGSAVGIQSIVAKQISSVGIGLDKNKGEVIENSDKDARSGVAIGPRKCSGPYLNGRCTQEASLHAVLLNESDFYLKEYHMLDPEYFFGANAEKQATDKIINIAKNGFKFSNEDQLRYRDEEFQRVGLDHDVVLRINSRSENNKKIARYREFSKEVDSQYLSKSREFAFILGITFVDISGKKRFIYQCYSRLKDGHLIDCGGFVK